MVARDVEISGDDNQDHHPSTSDGAGTGSGEDEKERARLLKHAKKCGYARIKGIGGLTAVDVVMRSYSLTLGRPNKKAAVDVSLGETMSVSRKHGEIYYDFEKKGFFLKVLGKNGIHVDGVLVLPDSATGGVVPLPSKSCLHVTADSDDRVFFLLPKRKKRVSTGSEGGTNKKGKVDVP